ncbi:hypothetical protein H6503_05420 [Candidatus Woesearchaeota archaeon]|nr:hypothetical protein [Candidatus Woesearchaeota archaeon]
MSYFTIEEVEQEEEVFTNDPGDATADSVADMDIVADLTLATCPACGKQTLKMEGGCHSCLNKECGFSKCDV